MSNGNRLSSGIHRPGGGRPDFGVVLRLHIGDRFYGTEIEVAAAATSDATVPLTSTATRLVVKAAGVSKHIHMSPNDDIATHYRARHVADGFDPGPFSGWTCAKPVGLTLSGDGGQGDDLEGDGQGDDPTDLEGVWGSEGRRRGDTFYSTDARLKNLVRVRDGTGDFEINRHNESGLAQHGDPVTFVNQFEAPPRVTFVAQKAKVFSTDIGSDAPQFMDMAAEDLGVAGFTMRAVLNTSQASSANTDGWSTAQNTPAPENGDVTLTADGDVAYSNLEDASTGSAATYRAFFDVDALVMNAANTLTVELGFNSASTSTGFTLGASRNYASGVNSTNEALGVNTALGSSYDLRLRISYSSDPGLFIATVTPHGEDNATPGVQWDKITGGSEETMTPSAGQRVLWQATETP